MKCEISKVKEMCLPGDISYPSKNHLARNMQLRVLQVFFIQDLQDVALNLARLALKMKFFLQELKNLALILQEFARKI